MTQFADVTIILEGRLYTEISLYETLSTYTKVCNVILSIYDTDINEINKICESFPEVIIIENNISEYKRHPVRIDQQFKNHTAISLLSGYVQICCVKKALEYVITPYVVKSKIDHYYKNIHKFIEHGLKTNKITSSSLFQRGCQDNNIPNRSRFCLTDTLFMGKIENIKLCFDLCHANALLTRVATGIWSPYFVHIFKLQNISIDLVDDETYIKCMEEVVDIYCINNFGPYKFKYFDSVREYMHDNTKTTINYLTYGCDC